MYRSIRTVVMHLGIYRQKPNQVPSLSHGYIFILGYWTQDNGYIFNK